MPLYEYKGLNKAGKAVKGQIDAESERMLRMKLRAEGVFPSEIIEKTSAERAGKKRVLWERFFQRVSLRDIAMITRQLSTMVKAHVPLVESLNALIDQVENNRLKLMLTEVRDRVNEGSSLADAMAAYPNVFSNLYTNMIRAGEAGGALDVVTSRLADFLEKQLALKNKVVSAMTYPVIMMSMAGLVLIGLFAFVIPQITSVLSEIGQALPLPTRVVIALSGAIKSYWYVAFLIGALAIWLFRKYIATEKGRINFDRFRLNMPVFGKIQRMVAISRFTRTLATLTKSGVSLITAMDICKFIVSNEYLKRIIETSKESITEGQSIAEPLKRSGEFPPLVTHMIAIGEKSGELEEMLVHIADAYDSQVENIISGLTSLLEPIMIVGMGIVVAIIALAVMLPLLQISGVS